MMRFRLALALAVPAVLLAPTAPAAQVRDTAQVRQPARPRLLGPHHANHRF